jgi:hypothetical protein
VTTSTTSDAAVSPPRVQPRRLACSGTGYWSADRPSRSSTAATTRPLRVG